MRTNVLQMTCAPNDLCHGFCCGGQPRWRRRPCSICSGATAHTACSAPPCAHCAHSSPLCSSSKMSSGSPSAPAAEPVAASPRPLPPPARGLSPPSPYPADRIAPARGPISPAALSGATSPGLAPGVPGGASGTSSSACSSGAAKEHESGINRAYDSVLQSYDSGGSSTCSKLQCSPCRRQASRSRAFPRASRLQP